MFKMNLNRVVICLLAGLISPFVSAVETAESGLTTGSVVGKHIFGLARDFRNDPLLINESPLIYKQADYQFELQAKETKYQVSLFHGPIAGAYLTERRGHEDRPFDTEAIDLGPVGGVYSIGAAIKSPWNTVLFSESTLVNGKEWQTLNDEFKAYFKNSEELVKPYQYGWLNEVILLDEKGTTKSIKNYVAGRTFASNILAMPDGKTFYLHDGEHSGNLYLFIAEEPNSFASGKLYVISGDTAPKPVELGQTSALKMKFKLKRSAFNHFFKSSKVKQSGCAAGYDYIETVYGAECLKVQKKNRKYVGQFEPIRMAALLGVKPFSEKGCQISFERHNNAIKITHTTAHDAGKQRQFSVVPNQKLGTQYLISERGSS